ncbi:MAG TPA: PIN domain-containing protein [Candidatus Acidoferrum sp.]|jgi:predicted nucleic acid-binding protein
MKPVLIDTGVIVALLDRSERQHEACAKLIKTIESPLLTCEPVIAESCYLLRKLPGAPATVVENVAAGIFQVSFQISTDTDGIRQRLRKYEDREIDLADACLIRMADQFGTGDILTLDKDFEIYRWGKNKTFRIMPGS